ncbi:MAG: hypothetical protein ACR2HF_02690 [Methylococcaceae bacterium]
MKAEISLTNGEKSPMTVYAGFAFSPSMLTAGSTSVVEFKPVTVDGVKALLADGYLSVCNPSHQVTLDAVHKKYGIQLDVPAVAPRVLLSQGDQLVVFSVSGLPRLGGDRYEYSEEEIASASLNLVLVTVTTQG